MAITVGCDPEFVVLDQNDRPIRFSFDHTDTHGNVGIDHGGSVGEFRPKAGTPAEVTENLKALITTFNKRYLTLNNYKMVAGGGKGYFVDMGGHIHFGGLTFDQNYISVTRQRNRYRSPVTPTTNDNRLICALDFFIGRRMKKVQGGRRSSGHYGKPSDIESKTWGFEYRTPPSWLTEPALTEAVLALAHLIASIWQVKPTAFDFVLQNKKTARKRDYQTLLNECTRDRAYYQDQIANYKRVVFSKTYNLANKDCVNLWMQSRTRITNVEGTITTRATRTTERITMQICQVKVIDRSADFETETVARVCQFGLSEVKVYPFQNYTPWQYRLTRDIRLKPDTIYISKEMRPYLRIPRGHEYKVRFIDIKRRNTEGTTEAMENVVFYNAERSVPAVKDAIMNIFATCGRTKLRRNAEDSGDDE